MYETPPMYFSVIHAEPLVDYGPLLVPAQSELDGAYAVKIFLDYHPARSFNMSLLARQSGLPENRLKAAFFYQFKESLETYWQRCQWRGIR